jgi:1,4-dihydroxy-2-naphthoate octaprenyltransferase
MAMKLGRLLEFFVIGIVFGIAEDLIAVYASTGRFSWHILWIVAIVAIPFAVISELIVDHYKPFHKKKRRKKKK